MALGGAVWRQKLSKAALQWQIRFTKLTWKTILTRNLMLAERISVQGRRRVTPSILMREYLLYWDTHLVNSEEERLLQNPTTRNLKSTTLWRTISVYRSMPSHSSAMERLIRFLNTLLPLTPRKINCLSFRWKMGRTKLLKFNLRSDQNLLNSVKASVWYKGIT